MTCTLLTYWLKLANPDAKASLLGVRVKLSQVEMLLHHMQRLNLIPLEGRAFFWQQVTTAGAWPLDDGHSSIDADEMLLRWMKTWGQWDVTADAVLRALPSSDKRPSTTTCADGQSYSKREAGKLPENAIMSFSHRPRTAM